jgi:hypothetical protein
MDKEQRFWMMMFIVSFALVLSFVGYLDYLDRQIAALKISCACPK